MKCNATYLLSALIIVLSITGVSPSSVAQEVEPITINATGRGGSIGEARKDAIMNALREVVGEYIEADTVIENEEVVNETITAFSNAESVTSKVIDQRFEGDEIVVECEVTIVPAQIVGRIQDAALSAVNIDGESLAAELAANQDNVQLQAETLDRLFKGLAPRLLVARLVDRNGKRIKDGRPPKDDIKMVGDNVLIALNIQIYYDLETYYEKVYPNLEKVLRAVALKSLPAEVNSGSNDKAYVEEERQAFTAYPTIERRWSTRSSQLGAKQGALQVQLEQPNPQQFVVFLSRSRDKYGMQEGFDAFVLNADLIEPFVKWQSNSNNSDPYDERNSLPHLRVVLESSSGNVLMQDEVSLFKRTLWGDERYPKGNKDPIPFSEPFGRPSGGTVSTWIFGNCCGYQFSDTERGKNPIVITPRFNLEEYTTDTIMLRVYLTVPKADFEKLATIRFDFWDPRVDR